jgi:hypothetical protein
MQNDDQSSDRKTLEGTSTIKSGQENRREPEPAPKPSQAEGDRETIEQDLEEKGGQGQG